MNSKTKGLIGFLLSVVIIIIVWTINSWFGVAALLLAFLVMLYVLRPAIFSMTGTRKYTQGKTDEAILWFSRAYATKRANLRTTVSYAYILLKNKELERSEEILQKLIKENPKSEQLPYIKSIVSLVLWKKGKLDEAVSMLEEVIQSYKTTSVYGSLGYMLIMQGDYEKALKFNLEAHEYNSSDNIINDNLAQNYFLLGMYDKAKEIYEPLLAKAPTFPEPYYNYGLMLGKLGDREKAVELMKKALDSKFSYLSSITKEEVEASIREFEN